MVSATPLLFTLVVVLSAAHCCVQLLDAWREVSIEERTRRAQVVFHGLAIAVIPQGDSRTYSVHFWIINVYKGADVVARLLGMRPDGGAGGDVVSVRDRRANVSHFTPPSQCRPPVQPQHYYIVFADGPDDGLRAKYGGLLGATTDWREDSERLVWAAVGWQPWSEWSPCSASCAEGVQERHRRCRKAGSCKGYNVERRRCNMFSCEGAVAPLSVEDHRYYHPSRGQWEHPPGRDTAWRLTPNSYLWVPSAHLFAGGFPREFALLITLRMRTQARPPATVFSLRSRRQQDAYLSVEVGGGGPGAGGGLRVVHGGRNGTHSVGVAAPIGDGEWHQLALGIHDDSSVRSYLDCGWVSTDILKRNSLDIPEDADIVIGYLFMGDLEQLVVVPTPAAVSQQCSASRQPLYDPGLEGGPPRGKPPTTTLARGGSPRPRMVAVPVADEDVEGSGADAILRDGHYDVEWSPWSPCSHTCGAGTQTRYSRCVDDGSRLELCMEAGGEASESRPCGAPPCGDSLEGGCPCLNGGQCEPQQRSCRCPRGYHGRRCERATCVPACANGGSCVRPSQCVCAPGYEGDTCETPRCSPPCRFGGRCVKPDTCLCPEGTSGDTCANFTCGPPCVNGGVCVAPDVCECPHSWSGRACERPVCDPPCAAGGACAGGNRCECLPGAAGTRCEKRRCLFGSRRLIGRRSQGGRARPPPEHHTVYGCAPGYR